jgi:peptidoglycan/LPS O-acetylase OafA/YrhL
MRAVAVILVLLFHAGVPAFSGGYIGVDVFFVISGFLITGLIVREMERTGTISLKRFYLRRVRRLLPAAALALTGAVALAVVALPVTRWVNVARDVRWSALYLVNWRFAAQAADYLAAEEEASPVQHFWSLAVEEQFYLIWPILLLTLGIVAARRSTTRRLTLLLGLTLVGLSSFVWSVRLTAVEPGRAFFVSTTRVWELAVGGGLAIMASHLAGLPRRAATVLAWAGLGGILWAGITFSSATPFPGWAALLPVASGAAVIAAGTAHPHCSASRMLGIGPARVVGSMSYSLYLWHWPLLVAARAVWGPLATRTGLAVVAVSVIPAWLAFRFVEQRWRYSEAFTSPPRRGLRYGLALTLLGVIAGTALAVAVPKARTEAAEVGIATDANPSVTTMQPVAIQETADVLHPDPLEARDDLPAVYSQGCHQTAQDSEVTSCLYGDLSSDIEVVIVGDSHAAQWIPALRVVARQQGWMVRTMTKSGCPLADVVIATEDTHLANQSCIQWNQNVVDELIDSRPDLVIATSAFWPTLLGPEGLLSSAETEIELARGIETSWSVLTQSGIELIALRDGPYPRIDIPECVITHRTSLIACAVDRDKATDGNTPHTLAANRLGIGIVDLTDHICRNDLCPAVVDNILVWRDRHHLTATFSESLAPALSKDLRILVPDLFVSRE